MTNRIIKIKQSQKGNQIAYAVLAPSVDQFILGGKARLVRCLATADMKVGGELDLSKYKVGQSQELPARTDGKPSSFTDVTWLDAV